MLQIAINRTAIAGLTPWLRRTSVVVVLAVVIAATTLSVAGCVNGPAAKQAPQANDKVHLLAPAVVLSPTATLFPLDAYDQTVDFWIPPQAPGTAQALLTEAQQQHALNDLRDRYFGGTDDGLGLSGSSDGSISAALSRPASRTASPWNRAFIERQNAGVNRQRMLAGIAWNVQRFGPDGPEQGYGPNLRPYPAAWINAIRSNIDTSQWTADPAYTADERAITTGNISLRLLPTSDPHFYDPRLPGEGYPFDNLQETELRPGTPLYLIGSTLDHGWLYVIAPDVSGWVKNDAIGRVDETFVARWRAAAKAGLGAVIAARFGISDVQGVYRFEAPIGTLLPLVQSPEGNATGNPQANARADRVWIPLLDMQRHAVMGQALVDENQVTRMPYRATPSHMAVLLKALQGRPYGWGGTGGYNDCSLELKSLFTPFGIWLPRHSSAQVEGPAMVDLSPQPFQARIDYLTRYGKPFMTIIDIRGHVMLYLGNRLFNGQSVPIVYEDVWGLTPPDASRRAIIGQSVIFPLLKRFPEDSGLQSQAARPVFRLGFPADQIDANDTAVGSLPPEDK